MPALVPPGDTTWRRQRPPSAWRDFRFVLDQVTSTLEPALPLGAWFTSGTLSRGRWLSRHGAGCLSCQLTSITSICVVDPSRRSVQRLHRRAMSCQIFRFRRGWLIRVTGPWYVAQ